MALIAVECRFEVLVPAPNLDVPGSSAALNAVRGDDGRLAVTRRRLDRLGGVHVLVVAVTPAFIVLAAAGGALGPSPVVVLSGINRGPDVGRTVLHSRTIGGAAGAAHGARAMAVSAAAEAALARDPEPIWDTGIPLPAVSWARCSKAPAGTVLNFNTPAVASYELKGVRWDHLAAFGAVRAAVA